MKALVEPSGRIAEIVADSEVFQVAPPLAWYDVAIDTTVADTWDGSRVIKHAPPDPTSDDVRAEAERRLQLGILVNGSPFKADDTSRQRLSEMIAQMQANPGTTITFVTAAGMRFSWSDVADAQLVATEIASYVVDVLGASAAMQGDLPTDLAGDRRWPAQPRVKV